MRFTAKIENLKLNLENRDEFVKYLSTLEGQTVSVEIKRQRNTRTARQNNALHLYFQLLADKLNDGGIDAKLLLSEEVDIPINSDIIKELLWRPIQAGATKKTSTTRLTTEEVSEIYDIVNRYVAEKFGVSVPFPTEELF